MLLTKQAMAVSQYVTRDDPRCPCGILVNPDGSTVATDGHRLAIYTPPPGPKADEYPAIEGCDPTSDGELEPFILPVDAAKQLARATPKRPTLPVLGQIALDVAETNQNAYAVFGVTDLENPRVFRPQKIAEPFPRYQNVLPKGKPLASIMLNARYLKQACELAIAACGEETQAATIEIFGPDGDKIPAPAIIRASGPNGAVLSVIMPIVSP